MNSATMLMGQCCLCWVGLFVSGLIAAEEPIGHDYYVALAPSLEGQLKRLRIYDRYLRTSEAVANFHAGWGDNELSMGTCPTMLVLAAAASCSVSSAVADDNPGTQESQRDPRWPTYHLMAPRGGWMGDVNGPVYHKGYYHIFYQHKTADSSGTCWGHARSKDLVTWEHMPVAFRPTSKNGEKHCYSGGTIITKAGVPMIFYTSLPSFQQRAVVGDDALVRWTQHSDNPLLSTDTHRGVVDIGSWRDPFIFTNEDRTYIVCGGFDRSKEASGRGRGMVSLYRAENDELTRWKYLGPLFYHPDSPDNACPNFFRLGDKWVLFMSRHRPHVVDYFVGTWDMETLRFNPEYADVLGYTESVYATQGLRDRKGRLVFWNSLHTWRSTGSIDDWPGCLTLPRVVGLRPDGSLSFEPLPELKQLRSRHQHANDIHLADSSHVVKEMEGDTLEIRVAFEPGDAKSFGIRVRRSNDGSRAVTIRYDGVLRVDGRAGLFSEQYGEKKDPVRRPFRLKRDEQVLTLRVFVDKASVEVFANGRACFEKVIHPKEPAEDGLSTPGLEDLGVELFAEGGSATVESLDMWEMKSIW